MVKKFLTRRQDASAKSNPPGFSNNSKADFHGSDFSLQLVQDLTSEARRRLEAWLAENGWAGYDPYDIRGTKWYLAWAKSTSLPARSMRKIPFWLIHRFPLATRKLTRTTKMINPKGMGLFTTAFCRLFETTGQEIYLERARESGEWLLAHPSKGYSGMGWGYPFDWQSVVFIPKGTPSVVVSSVVGDGLWQLGQLTGETRYLDACADVCQFILQGLNRTEINERTLCFSYTPLDGFLVHNANLFGAEFLARVGQRLGMAEWCDIAVRAGNYFLLEQREDGSVYYWGTAQNENNPYHRDCYHSGFEIRSLWGLWKSTGDSRFRDAALKYFRFFRESYIGEDGAVMNLPGRLFPLDIHACAEALLCPAVMSEVKPEQCQEIIAGVLPWVLRQMQNNDGSFANMAFENGRIDRTPYIRWGQAWMLRALAEVQFAASKWPSSADESRKTSSKSVSDNQKSFATPSL